MEVAVCQWPTAVGFTQTNCSGVLVHPEIVVSAASCLLPIEMPYAEQLPGGSGTCETSLMGVPCSAVGGCKRHPDFDPTTGAYDLQYCWVFEPPEGMPMTPPALGCELDALEPGAAVTIVGFGGAAGSVALKEGAETTIAELDELTLTAGGDGVGHCSEADRGGPAFVQVADGSWRVAGVFGRAETCGEPGTYTTIAPLVGWIEESSGKDITPCHDPDGVWDPGPDCGDFATDPGHTHGDWSGWCAGEPLSGPGTLCGPEYVPGASETGDASGGADAQTGAAGDEAATSANDTAAATGGGEPADSGGSGGAGLLDGGSSSSGCGCTASPAPSAAVLFTLLVTRRRRRPSYEHRLAAHSMEGR